MSDKNKTAKETGDGKNPRTVKNRKARLIVFLIIVALIAATVTVVLNMRLGGIGNVIKEEWKTPKYLREKTINILVTGVDMDPDDESRVDALTDVIMVVNVDLEAHKATILQIPRDTYVGYDKVYTGKINALYNWGSSTDKKKESAEPAGIGYLVEAINDQFKLPVDNYVLITMEGFRKAVDMLGGVEITLENPMTFNIKDSNGNVIDTKTLEAGVNTLDGATADLFVRYRDYGADKMPDVERTNMQRAFMAALVNKAISTPTIDLVSLANAVFPYLETDFTLNQLISLALEVKNMSTESITTVRAPGEAVSRYGIYGLDVWTLHRAELADVLNEYMRPYTDDVPETELGVIEVQKTTDEYDDAGATLNNYDNKTEDAA